MDIIEEILASRGLDGAKRDAFLNPRYDDKHDPYLLPDMQQAVERLVVARAKQERVTIYGDYDIDGLTATALLLDALEKFEFKNVSAFIPNRFVEGYGLTIDAIERIASEGSQLIITVDCGSLSEGEIIRASELGVDVIVTDHHNVAPIQPPAVAVINPKRLLADYPEEYRDYVIKDDSKMKGNIYPFVDLSGVGVAFKLVQAMQHKIDGMGEGHEKWLLDLVALGTVCDVVNLIDENRANVYWGLKVLTKAHRPGLKALMAVAGVVPGDVSAKSLGFALGPRMNAAGRMETAQHSLDLLTTKDPMQAYVLAKKLDVFNTTRKNKQNIIFQEASLQAEKFSNDNVLVVSSTNWSHGIIGIVAAKLLEKYKKPTFVLEEMGEEAKGSARSYGDFSVADAIRSAEDLIIKGGGHKFAAGVTLTTKHIPAFRTRVNQYYRKQKLSDQQKLLLPKEDATVKLAHVTDELVEKLTLLEPCGTGNPRPILKSENLLVLQQRRMGTNAQHLKMDLQDDAGQKLQMLAFSAPDYFFIEPGNRITVWYQPETNEWNGRCSIEGRLLHLEHVGN